MTEENLELYGNVLKGHPDHRKERRRYLAELIEEYHLTKRKEARRQVFGNLANFAYDPYNYIFFRELNVVTDVFLHQLLHASDAKLVEFSLGALCNFASDDLLGRDIIRGGGISIITKHLSSITADCVVSAISILIFLIKPDTRDEILSADVISQMNHLAASQDARIRNVANVFLQVYYNVQPG